MNRDLVLSSIYVILIIAVVMLIDYYVSRKRLEHYIYNQMAQTDKDKNIGARDGDLLGYGVDEDYIYAVYSDGKTGYYIEKVVQHYE